MRDELGVSGGCEQGPWGHPWKGPGPSFPSVPVTGGPPGKAAPHMTSGPTGGRAGVLVEQERVERFSLSPKSNRMSPQGFLAHRHCP